MNPAQAPAPSPEGLALVPFARELRGFPLGTIVLRLGLLPENEINAALEACDAARKPLGRHLVEQGLLTEAQLGQALATQKGLPFVAAEDVVPDERALELLSAHTANMLGVLPLGFEGDTPVVAISDPTNGAAIDQVRAAVGGTVIVAVTCPVKLREALAAAYCPTEAPVIQIAPDPPPDALAAPELSSVFRVTILLAGGERIDAALCRTRKSADTRVRELVKELDRGGWVERDGRLLRADAVTSIEVVAAPVLD